MQQPAFWLKVTKQYVIENFEELLTYVKKYNYIPEEETPDGDFCQTFKYLHDVATEYAERIRQFNIFDTPAFDIPTEKVVRLLTTSLLTAKKMGEDDFDILAALINLLILSDPNLHVDIERRYAIIVKHCICRTPVLRYLISFSDLDPETFTLGALRTKLANTGFAQGSDNPYVYEHRGCLLMRRGELTLTNVNFHDSAKAKLKTELETGEGLIVKTTSASAKHEVEDLLRLYPLIGGEFDKVKPSPRPTIKSYTHGDTFIARVRRVQGVKVEVESIDERYHPESGNVFIDKQIGLVPQDDFRHSLEIGSYLPIYKNEQQDLPYRVDLKWVQDFVEDYANDIVDNGDPDLRAIHIKTEPWGTRWLTESGLHLNVFNNEMDPDMRRDLYRAVEEDLPCLLRVGVAQKWNVKGHFRRIYDEEAGLDREIFKQEAYATFVEELQEEAGRCCPSPEEQSIAGTISAPQVRLFGILTYQLALKRNYGNTFARIEGLITAMLLLRMAEDTPGVEFVRSQLDYQKAIVAFAHGATPSALAFNAAPLSENVADLRQAEEIIGLVRDYREQTDTIHTLATSSARYKSPAEVADIVGELVRASNSLLGKIDIMELNRIKKTICAHLGVDDEYHSIGDAGTNYGVESEFLEFKASCVFPPAQHRSTSLLNDINFQRWTILKAVCAFLNSNSGGDLLIGVSDTGFAVGLQTDIEALFKERVIFEPTSDRLRNYINLFIDQAFSTSDGRVTGTAITAGRVECKIEQNAEGREIIRVKVAPYPWDVVKINAPDRPARFMESYIRTSGASTPLNSDALRETKLRKLKSLDKDDYKTSRIMQAIDNRLLVEIKNYSSASGIGHRRLEPYMLLPGNKGFLAYDLDRKDIRMFRFSRFADTNLKLTDEHWRNEKKHRECEVDIFGSVTNDTEPALPVQIKLSDYARTLLIEECDLRIGKGEAHEGIIIPNPVCADRSRYPWLLDTRLNGYAGIARFVMGLPADTAVLDNPELSDYIRARLTSHNEASAPE